MCLVLHKKPQFIAVDAVSAAAMYSSKNFLFALRVEPNYVPFF